MLFGEFESKSSMNSESTGSTVFRTGVNQIHSKRVRKFNSLFGWLSTSFNPILVGGANLPPPLVDFFK